MSVNIVSFESYMAEGEEALGRGNMFDGAAALFSKAVMVANATKHTINEVHALQMLSVAYSLDGKPDLAKRYSSKAIMLAGDDDALVGRILRDAGMAYLRQAIHMPRGKKRDTLLIEADEDFSNSYTLLTRSSDNRLEAAVTYGFMGRHRLIVGETEDAYRHFTAADKTLRGGSNPDYELNNLIWLLRADLSYSERWKYRKERILPLIQLTGQTRRYDELRLIMIGGDPLYRFVERAGWIQKLVQRLRGK